MDEAGAGSKLQIGCWARKAWGVFIDFIVPPKCLVCRASVLQPASLCLTCWSALNHIEAPVCNVMGTPFAYDQGAGAISAAALADPPAWDRARAAVGFDDASRKLVHAFKYRDTLEAGLLMARLMGRAGRDLLSEADVIIPVPLHRWRLWRRRFNQAAYLSHQLGRMACKPVRSDILTRTRASRSQVGLAQDERRKNVAKIFAVAPEHISLVAGRRILLVDDVLTTGATAGSCAATLKKAGAAYVDVIAFALVLEPRRPHIG